MTSLSTVQMPTYSHVIGLRHEALSRSPSNQHCVLDRRRSQGPWLLCCIYPQEPSSSTLQPSSTSHPSPGMLQIKHTCEVQRAVQERVQGTGIQKPLNNLCLRLSIEATLLCYW